MASFRRLVIFNELGFGILLCLRRLRRDFAVFLVLLIDIKFLMIRTFSYSISVFLQYDL